MFIIIGDPHQFIGHYLVPKNRSLVSSDPLPTPHLGAKGAKQLVKYIFDLNFVNMEILTNGHKLVYLSLIIKTLNSCFSNGHLQTKLPSK